MQKKQELSFLPAKSVWDTLKHDSIYETLETETTRGDSDADITGTQSPMSSTLTPEKGLFRRGSDHSAVLSQ
jgi:hypothetical protein